jgi:hypothetical protein
LRLTAQLEKFGRSYLYAAYGIRAHHPDSPPGLGESVAICRQAGFSIKSLKKWRIMIE